MPNCSLELSDLYIPFWYSDSIVLVCSSFSMQMQIRAMHTKIERQERAVRSPEALDIILWIVAETSHSLKLILIKKMYGDEWWHFHWSRDLSKTIIILILIQFRFHSSDLRYLSHVALSTYWLEKSPAIPKSHAIEVANENHTKKRWDERKVILIARWTM